MSTTFGPFAFATSQLIFLVACAVTFCVGWLVNNSPRRFSNSPLNLALHPPDQPAQVPHRLAVGDALFRIIVVGLLCARTAFVIKYVQSYVASPLSLLNVRDGGFLVWVGLLAGGLWTCREWRLLARQAHQFEPQGPQSSMPPSARRAQVSLIIALATGFGVAATGNLWLQRSINQTQLPQLTVFSTQNEPVHLAQAFIGKPLVINLWASWCPPCVREMPLLEKAALAWPTVQIVAINQGESQQRVEQFLIEHQLKLPLVLMDTNAQLGNLIGSQALPTTLFLNSDGSLSYTHVGEFSAATLENALHRLH